MSNDDLCGFGLPKIKREGETVDYGDGLLRSEKPNPNYESKWCEFSYNAKQKLDPDTFKKLCDIFDDISDTPAYLAALVERKWKDDDED